VARSPFMYDLMMKFYPLSRLWDRLPFRRRRESVENTSVHLIPLNLSAGSGESVALPMTIIRALIMRAGTVAVMRECLCRRGEKCKSFPADTGCLLLGSAALDLHPGLGRLVTVDEALAHAASALEMGLLPTVVHNEFDAWLWGINYRRMLNVCFCCECCCSLRRDLRERNSEGFFRNVHRLPGLSVRVTGDCDGCGACVDVCMSRAIYMEQGRARINDENCKGCGRCVSMCPQSAIRMEGDNSVDSVQLILEHYMGRVSIGEAGE